MHFKHDFRSPPVRTTEQILTLWATDAFYDELAEELEVDHYHVEIDHEPGLQLVSRERLVISTKDVPAAFRKLPGVGGTIAISRTADLRADSGVIRGDMRAQTDDGRLSFKATTSIDNGLLWKVDGPVRAGLPWPVRDPVESAVARVLKGFLRTQAVVTEKLLDRLDEAD